MPTLNPDLFVDLEPALGVQILHHLVRTAAAAPDLDEETAKTLSELAAQLGAAKSLKLRSLKRSYEKFDKLVSSWMYADHYKELGTSHRLASTTGRSASAAAYAFSHEALGRSRSKRLPTILLLDPMQLLINTVSSLALLQNTDEYDLVITAATAHDPRLAFFVRQNLAEQGTSLSKALQSATKLAARIDK